MTPRSHRRPSRARPGLPDVPVGRCGAAALGWSDGARRYALAQGDLELLRRGVVAPPALLAAAAPNWERRRIAHLRAARAAAVSSPRATISHASAALVYDLPVYGLPDRPCLTVPAGTALRRVAHAHLHRATLGPDDVTEAGADRVTTPARTVMDVAREFGVPAGVVTGDAALHRGLVDGRALADAWEQCAGWPGRRHARVTLRMADGRTESPLESLSRLRIAASDVPAPGPRP